MPFAEWNDNLRLGHERIDRAHREIFALLNGMHEMLQGGCTHQEGIKALIYLTNHIGEHMGDEERMIEDAGLDCLVAHRREHAAMLAELESVVERYIAHEDSDGAEVLEFLADWYGKHLAGADRTLAQALLARENAGDLVGVTD